VSDEVLGHLRQGQVQVRYGKCRRGALDARAEAFRRCPRSCVSGRVGCAHTSRPPGGGCRTGGFTRACVSARCVGRSLVDGRLENRRLRFDHWRLRSPSLSSRGRRRAGDVGELLREQSRVGKSQARGSRRRRRRWPPPASQRPEERYRSRSLRCRYRAWPQQRAVTRSWPRARRQPADVLTMRLAFKLSACCDDIH
jgi:hypothetical protein